MKSPLYTFTLIMTGLYIVLGLFVMFSPQMTSFLPGWKHWVLGGMLIVYAFLRFSRLKTIKKNTEQQR